MVSEQLIKNNEEDNDQIWGIFPESSLTDQRQTSTVFQANPSRGQNLKTKPPRFETDKLSVCTYCITFKFGFVELQWLQLWLHLIKHNAMETYGGEDV
jgi:hypothetical protein